MKKMETHRMATAQTVPVCTMQYMHQWYQQSSEQHFVTKMWIFFSSVLFNS